MQAHVSVTLREDPAGIEWNESTFFCFDFPYPDISKEKWDEMMAANQWNSVELRDNRYNQIVHMVSAANGAEEFYSTEVCIPTIHSSPMSQSG